MLHTHSLPDLPVPANPVVQRMLDIILTKARDQQPTMDEDLEEFTAEELATHWTEAKRLAKRQLVRTIDRDVMDSPRYDRPARLGRAVDLIAGLLPAEAQVIERLRLSGYSNQEVAELWGDVVSGAARALCYRLDGAGQKAAAQ